MFSSLSRRLLLPLAAIAIVSAYFTVRFSESSPDVVSIFAILAIAAPGVAGLIKALGFKRGLVLMGFLTIFVLLFESFAIETGVPYGQFYYGDSFGWKVFDKMPLVAAFGWMPILLGVMPAVLRFADSFFYRVMLIAVFMAAVDFVLDPGMVALGFWFWEDPGMYYGVPFVNMLGWLVSSSLAGVIFLQFSKNRETYIVKNAIWFELPLFFLITYWMTVNVLFEQWIPVFIGVVIFITRMHLKNENLPVGGEVE